MSFKLEFGGNSITSTMKAAIAADRAARARAYALREARNAYVEYQCLSKLYAPFLDSLRRRLHGDGEASP